jgi:hypothetical protein
MIYIAFSKQTHKLFAKIFCRNFRHCAPMIKTKDKFILYQFVERNHIAKIKLSKRDLQILAKHGWEFIQYSNKNAPQHAKDVKTMSLTCVQFTKRICGIKNIFIQRPDDLYKYVKQKNAQTGVFIFLFSCFLDYIHL